MSPPLRRDYGHSVDRSRYTSRFFQNPYFSHPRHLPARPLVIMGIALGLGIGVASFLFTSRVFALEHVRIQGLSQTPPAAVRAATNTYLDTPALWGISTHRNRFFFSQKELVDQLTRAFAFERVSIQRDGRTLQMTLAEAGKGLLWSHDGRVGLISPSGILLREISAQEAERLRTPPIPEGPLTFDDAWSFEGLAELREDGSRTWNIGMSVLSPVQCEAIRKSVQDLYDGGVPIVYLEWNPEIGTWIQIRTQVGYQILLEPNTSVATQVSRFFAVLRTIPDSQALQYVDVRFEDHVYYK